MTNSGQLRSTDPVQILAPRDDGELRIPALLRMDDELVCLFDVRPRPLSGHGSDFNGEVMASDLPNPNRIAFSRKNPGSNDQGGNDQGGNDLRGSTWSAPEYLPGTPAVSSDPCVGLIIESGGGQASQEIVVGYASTSANVSYISSRSDGARLEPWLAWGPSLTNLKHRKLGELYDAFDADAMFATSGSTVTFNGAVLLPYVVRSGDRTHIRVVHVRGGEILAMSEPNVADEVNLDETTLAIVDGKVILNSRVQGFEGRGAGVRYLAQSSDGISFSKPRPWRLDDPGCNAKQLGEFFIHPHSPTARERGAVLSMRSGDPLCELGDGEFGYSDAVWDDDGLLIVFERNSALWETGVLPMSRSAPEKDLR